MKIVVIGGTGLIGSKAVANLRQGGFDEWLRRSQAAA
jgi:nucleoside-diphosphate-sugar epimerase